MTTQIKRFSISEFLLSVALLAMAEYIIIAWVSGYGANSSIVSYVSFAGTIVSIILAVLAIVYSYYQTFAQQRDSAAVSTQIESLRRVVEDIQTSRVDLSAQADRFAEISGKLDKHIAITEASRADMKEIGKKIGELEKKEVAQSQVSPAIEDEVDLEVISRAIVSNANSLELASLYVLEIAVANQMTAGKVRNQIIEPAYLGKEEFPDLLNWVDGIWTGQWMTLTDIGLVETVAQGRDTKFIKMAEELRTAIINQIPTPPKPPKKPSMTLESVRAAATTSKLKYL